MGPASCAFKAVELAGPVIDAMSIEGRQTICGQAMFLGANTMLIAPDARTLEWLQGRAQLDLAPVHPDADAVYERVVTVDVSALEPIVVVPPSPANTRDLSEHVGLEVHAGYLGSCASGWKTCAPPPRCCAGARSSPASSCTWCPPRRPSWRRPRARA
jgi:3-isopropylmalate/(R)-2-methylmalate dehydratase large subunit